MKKENKYIYLSVIQTCYAGYWEDESAYTDFKELQEDKRNYRNEGIRFRTVNRRVLNPKYTGEL